MLLPGMAQDVKTTFQTGSAWKPTIDVRSDAVMVYGIQGKPIKDFQNRVDSWRKKGYTTHFMTGIAWGSYSDYFSGKWDGSHTWMKDRRT